MDKNKIEQKRSGAKQEKVKEDTTLRLTADLKGNYLLDERTSEMNFLFTLGGKCSPGSQDVEEENRGGSGGYVLCK